MSDESQLRANFAKRLECVELAPAFSACGQPECKSAGKPDALQTLRAIAAIANE